MKVRGEAAEAPSGAAHPPPSRQPVTTPRRPLARPPVGRRGPRLQVFLRVHQQPPARRVVSIRLQERGGVRAERTIDKTLQPAQLKPIVAPPARRPLLAQ